MHGRGRARSASSAASTCSGSERHESRRIDNQLRGRSGRQGDPGESRFFLSLEDDLMRLFATGAMNWVMGRALPDDVPDRGQDGDQGHRAGPEHRRGPQRRDPQGRPQVRRGDERAAQGDLRPAHADHRGRGPAGATPSRCSTSALDERRGPAPARRDYPEEWDLDGLVDRGSASTTRPSSRPRTWPRRPPAGQVTESLLDRGPRATTSDAGRVDARRRGDGPPARAGGHAADHRPAVAGAPGRDGLPAGGHQPAGHGPAGPAGGLAAGGLRDVRPADGRHRRRLPRYVMHVQVRSSRSRPPSPTWPGPATRPPTTRCQGDAAASAAALAAGADARPRRGRVRRRRRRARSTAGRRRRRRPTTPETASRPIVKVRPREARAATSRAGAAAARSSSSATAPPEMAADAPAGDGVPTASTSAELEPCAGG